MKWTELPSGQTNRAFQVFMGALGEKAEVIVMRINTDPSFVERMATYAIKSDIELPMSHQKARDIMGANMFGIEEAIKYFRANPSRQQIIALAKIPFSDQTLIACKDTHILVAVFPLSILNIRRITKQFVEKTLFCAQDWYDDEMFAKYKGKAEWQLVRKEPVPDSFSKSWITQKALLSKAEEIPKAQIVVYMIIGHFLATGERLFDNFYVRCSDIGPEYHVGVGLFDEDGLYLDLCYANQLPAHLGISSARK